MVVPGVGSHKNLRYSHLNSQHFSSIQGVISGVAKQTDMSYVFRAVLGSLVVQMKMYGGPGGKQPVKTEIFTPQFTPIGLF